MSFVAYLGLLAVVLLQRLLELRLSKRNSARARAAGAVEMGARHYPWMVLLHSAFLVVCVLEVWLLDRPFVASIAVVALVVLLIATTLRYSAIRALGERWTTRVFHWPDRPLIETGPYRMLRHPNYLAVVLEMAALPLVHSAWFTAVLFSILNGWLLAVRIRIENKALTAVSESELEPNRLTPEAVSEDRRHG